MMHLKSASSEINFSDIRDSRYRCTRTERFFILDTPFGCVPEHLDQTVGSGDTDRRVWCRFLDAVVACFGPFTQCWKVDKIILHFKSVAPKSEPDLF